jgi:glyoxylase-like metal-dependent hydrolase (beta-lactamase superfamily II)
MEVLPGVHQVLVNYKNRPLKLYLLRVGAESMLIDTGFADTPEKEILPYFRAIGFDPRQLTYVMLTHPDVDHVGGAYAMRAAAPQARFLCGTADREQIETPENLARMRARAHYFYHGLGPDDAKLAGLVRNAGGAGNRLDFARTFDAQEKMVLGGRELTILHLPGHSEGHLGVHVPWLNAAIIADAVHGTANRFLDGKAAFACTYMYVDAYLGTIAQLRAMKLEALLSCHWPDCLDQAAASAFLKESETYARHAEGVILEVVRAAGEGGITLKEVCIRAKARLGDWPSERDLDTRSMACGHLQRLTNVGCVRTMDGTPTKYAVETVWRGLR